MEDEEFSFYQASVVDRDVLDVIKSVEAANGVTLSNESVFQMIERMISAIEIKVLKNMICDRNLEYKRILNFSPTENNEVEAVIGRNILKGITIYQIKWLGWPSLFNTWEPEENLNNCDELLSAFKSKYPDPNTIVVPPSFNPEPDVISQVMTLLRNAVVLTDITPAKLFKIIKERLYPKREVCLFCSQNPSVHINLGAQKRKPSLISRFPVNYSEIVLREFAKKLNSATPDEPPINVLNEVDSETPPLNFESIRICIFTKDVQLPEKEVIQSCDCPNLKGSESCWSNRQHCSCIKSSYLPYNSHKKLIAPLEQAIFECSCLCKCGSSCPFRVVQLGRKIPLTIFRTSNGRGWGIKTPQRIPKGTFVIEYVGEIYFPFCQIISISEALHRGELYDRENKTYLFEADYDLPSQFAIDSYHKGNASRFINHSCDPNLISHPVFIDGANPKLPRIAFFARRNIKEGEELTIDYQLQLLDTGSIAKVDSSNNIKTGKVQSFSSMSSGDQNACVEPKNAANI
ncbi:unnamed protein product [Hymenolepis diminuta]|uniref:Histone-lysine N-methyltransferase n=1 Tax=Hymenolepis diminuta TaxID=6216 RepID=A0A0R3SF13_HYMDI|nr:unnamed protein product [Hymenolepis diminuta]